MEETELAIRLEQAVCGVVRGQEATVRKVLACKFVGDHVLLEDFPGTGKTTLAKAISRSIGGAASLIANCFSRKVTKRP